MLANACEGGVLQPAAGWRWVLCGMGWDAMVWDGMGWDGLGWVGGGVQPAASEKESLDVA